MWSSRKSPSIQVLHQQIRGAGGLRLSLCGHRGEGVQSYKKHADIILKFSLILGHLVMQKGLYIDKIDDEKFKFVPCVKFFMNSIQNL